MSTLEVHLPLWAYEELLQIREDFNEGFLPQPEHDEKVKSLISRFSRLPAPYETLYISCARQARSFSL